MPPKENQNNLAPIPDSHYCQLKEFNQHNWLKIAILYFISYYILYIIILYLITLDTFFKIEGKMCTLPTRVRI